MFFSSPLNQFSWLNNPVSFKLTKTTTWFGAKKKKRGDICTSYFLRTKKRSQLTATEPRLFTTQCSPKRCRVSGGRARFPRGELGLFNYWIGHRNPIPCLGNVPHETEFLAPSPLETNYLLF